jgi:tetratricopeptide (TPR) repeat protein
VEDDAPLPDETHLAALAPRFLAAAEQRAAGKVDAAIEGFQAILLIEPRLAEPRLELGRIWLEFGRLEDAEAEAREAIRLLTLGGQWTEEVPEHVLLSLGWALLGEILKEKASTDEVVFGDPEVFRDLLEQSRAAFAQAAALDPTDTASQMNALELGDGVLGGPEGD